MPGRPGRHRGRPSRREPDPVDTEKFCLYPACEVSRSREILPGDEYYEVEVEGRTGFAHRQCHAALRSAPAPAPEAGSLS